MITPPVCRRFLLGVSKSDVTGILHSITLGGDGSGRWVFEGDKGSRTHKTQICTTGNPWKDPGNCHFGGKKPQGRPWKTVTKTFVKGTVFLFRGRAVNHHGLFGRAKARGGVRRDEGQPGPRFGEKDEGPGGLGGKGVPPPP